VSSAALQGQPGGHGGYSEDTKEQAAALLCSGLSVPQVAAALGTTPTTIGRWKREDRAFQARLKVLRQEAKDAAIQRIEGLVDTAIGVLAELATDTTQPGAVRRAAASDLLDRAGVVGPHTAETLNDPADLEQMSAADLAAALRRASEALEKPPTPAVDSILDTPSEQSDPVSDDTATIPRT
jgi:transposase-like protein